jgi:hypothetical protein
LGRGLLKETNMLPLSLLKMGGVGHVTGDRVALSSADWRVGGKVRNPGIGFRSHPLG